MELTVWVDGIQRVISGASDSTTCQDVVIALASAVGRTGRFTLIEKWRDKQRALFPSDCPLQSLHRWGEYAAEVRFYLVQAETDKVKQQETQQQKGNAQSQKFNKVLNNFIQPQTSQHHLNPKEAESLKRSSTFSCAHRTNLAAVPALAKASSQKPSALSQNKHSVPPPTSSARGYPAGQASVPNGELENISSTSSTDSSPRPSSTSLKYSQSGMPPIPPARRDARELHPANMPEALSIKETNFPSSSFSASESTLASSQQLFSYSKWSPKPLVSPSALTQQTYSHSQISSATTAALHSPHSLQLKPSFTSQQPYPQSGHSQKMLHLKAVPSAQLSPTSVGHENISPQPRHNQKPSQQGERSHDTNSREIKSAPSSVGLQGPSGHVINSDKVKNAQVIDGPSYDHYHDNVFYDDTNETHLGIQHFQNNRTPHLYSCSYSSDAGEGLRPGDTVEAQMKNKAVSDKTATLDRHKQRSTLYRELPSKSMTDLNAESGMNQQQQSGGGSKLTFVDSALIRHKPNTDGFSQKTSSFTSAVAHIRNNGDVLLQAPMTETHLKQHVSASSVEGAVHNKMSTQDSIYLVESSHSTTSNRQQHHDSTVQPSNNPPLALNSISSSRHNSAFTEVSPKSSYQNSNSSSKSSTSSVSSAPVAYNLDDMGAAKGNHQKHDSQTSLEVEEYDLDRNFPDVLHRDISGGGEQSSLQMRQFLEDEVVSNHIEEEHIQFLRIIDLQGERMRTQEAQINAASSEITTMEEEESNDMEKLEALATEVSQLENQEAELKVELQDLEISEWMKVLDREQKFEAHVKLQIGTLKEKLKQMELQIKQLNEEADHKSEELKVEEERISEEQKKNEELQQKAILEMVHLKDQLSDVNRSISDKDKELKEVEKMILEADSNLRQQEEKVSAIQEELKDTNSEDIQASVQPKDLSSNSVPVIDCVTSDAVSAFSTSDNGEAILKILEGQLSPHPSAFHSGDGGDSLGGITSAQHTYKSAMAAKNPNGVWV